MRTLVLSTLTLFSIILMSAGWRTDFARAKADAKEKNKLVLLKFSGSDWCLPCIRMEKEVFSNETYKQFADQNLEMVNADFPRKRKNQLGASQVKQNEELAQQYNKEGHYPYTLLLTADGKILKTWDGYQGQKPEDMVQEMKKYVTNR